MAEDSRSGNDTDADGDQLAVATIEGQAVAPGLNGRGHADGNPVTATNPAVGTVSVDAAGTITFTPTRDYHGAVRFAYEATRRHDAFDGPGRRHGHARRRRSGRSGRRVHDGGGRRPARAGPRRQRHGRRRRSADGRDDRRAGGRARLNGRGHRRRSARHRHQSGCGHGHRGHERHHPLRARGRLPRRGALRLRGDRRHDARRHEVVGTVTPVADAPVAADDAFTMAEDAGPRVLDLVGNDTDADGDQLTVATIEGQAVNARLERRSDGRRSARSPPATLRWARSGSMRRARSRFEPAATTTARSASPTRRPTARRPRKHRSSGTVTPVADAPVATDDAFTMAEDAGPLVLDLRRQRHGRRRRPADGRHDRRAGGRARTVGRGHRRRQPGHRHQSGCGHGHRRRERHDPLRARPATTTVRSASPTRRRTARRARRPRSSAR